MCIAIGDNGLALQAVVTPWGFALVLMAAEGMGRIGNLKMMSFQEDLSFSRGNFGVCNLRIRNS